ncbi:protein translocase subunit SecD [Candidatus Dependentiae bacterium]|nr:protein translocase subunit SecD [Candidatus Dependentiae bacterium]
MTTAFKRILSSSLFIWIALTFVGGYYIYNIKKYVTFGIDLVGGLYLTLEVQTDKAVEAEFIDAIQNIAAKLEKEDKNLPSSQKIEKNKAILNFSTQEQAKSAYQIIGDTIGQVSVKQSANQIVLSISDQQILAIKKDAVESNIRVLHARLDEFSVAEIPISPAGENRIIIEFPDVKNPEVAKARIGKTALLEMKPVEAIGVSEQDVLDKYGGSIPEGMIIIPGKAGRRSEEIYYLVPAYADLTGRFLKDAKVGLSERGFGISHGVEITFNAEGADKFYELTRKNVNRPVAIIVDNVVISAPMVNEAIRGGKAIITFGESGSSEKILQEAHELANMLRSGSFVAPVTIVEERAIGPSLGYESIKKGLISCGISLILLLLFSLIFYKMAGFFAFVVLLYNLLLILLGLIWLRATLTLPGIAGMVLTIGMAIDSSILIYEKIKEELSLGVSMRKAVDIGFSDAMVVILDANITTFIVGAVLYFLGTGPIKGFAVTLMLGILSTLITGLILLRSIFTFVLTQLRTEKISI